MQIWAMNIIWTWYILCNTFIPGHRGGSSTRSWGGGGGRCRGELPKPRPLSGWPDRPYPDPRATAAHFQVLQQSSKDLRVWAVCTGWPTMASSELDGLCDRLKGCEYWGSGLILCGEINDNCKCFYNFFLLVEKVLLELCL